MLRRMTCFAMLIAAVFVMDLPDAEAARRRGGFFRRAQATRMSRRPTSPVVRNNSYRSTRSTKLHETHSRSAILDGFFGPYSGGQGHDRSWYVGK